MKPEKTPQEQWFDYKWQLQNSLHSSNQIKKTFPNIGKVRLQKIQEYEKQYRFQLTPYLLTCLKLDKQGNPDSLDPFTSLFFPFPEILLCEGSEAYKPHLINWEMPEELVVPGSSAFHWKYSDRLLYRYPRCMSICSYCFEAHRVIDRDTPKKPKTADWKLGMKFIKSHPEIREFIFSGGEPLLASDEVIERKLADLRNIAHIETIRFNSATLMHCPMRITDKLIKIFKHYEVTEMGIHIVHPCQITKEFKIALDKFDEQGYSSIIKLAQIPLLRGVNDDTETMKELLCKLEQCRVKAYYLLHGIPWTLGAVRFRTSVYRGVEILKPLYRTLSHVAWPEYVIVARGGKATVPLERNDFWLKENQVKEMVWAIDDTSQPLSIFASRRINSLYKYNGSPEFIYSTYQGNPVIIFRNWKNKWEMYLDKVMK